MPYLFQVLEAKGLHLPAPGSPLPKDFDTLSAKYYQPLIAWRFRKGSAIFTLFADKTASTAFKRAIALGLAGALLMTGVVVGYANINATDLGSGNDETKLSVNTFVDDAEVTLVNAGMTIVSAAASGVGDSAPGVEVHMNLPGVNNALTADNYAYSFIMQETIGDDWKEGEGFRIRVYGYDSSGPASAQFTTLTRSKQLRRIPSKVSP